MEIVSDLSGVRVGDELVSLRYGPVKAIEVTARGFMCLIYSITGTPANSWGKDGRFYMNDYMPDLYWPGVRIIPAEPPKRMKKVTVEKWVGLYQQDSYGNFGATVRSSLSKFSHPERMVGEPQRITWEIEVEDE